MAQDDLKRPENDGSCEKKEVLGYLPGTFDLFHIGHLNIIKRARKECDRLVVGVHTSGAWKGKETFIPLEERMEIIRALKYVDDVIEAPDDDHDAWPILHYDKLFIGDDYRGTDRFNFFEEYFSDKGVEIVYFPYTKLTSSTKLRAALDQLIDKME